MTDIEESANWALLGEAIIGIARRPQRRFLSLPSGFHRIPGPVVILAERFVDSPIGPFLSLSFGEPVRLGFRPGYYFGISVLNSPDARRAGRQFWGFPHELGTLHWLSNTGTRGMIWEERGIELRAQISGRPMPLLVPIRTVQRRTDGPVVVPARLRSMARRSHIEMQVASDDVLSGLNGIHHGFTLSGMLLRRRPARRPRGLFSTLRAPLRAPEPGVVHLQTPNVS